MWTWPLTWSGVVNPALGPRRPNLIFVVVLGDLFVEGRPTEVIDRVVETIVLSDHIGLLVTKYTKQMAAYFSAKSPLMVRLWQSKLLLCFSAENQEWFDRRWADMRALAEAAWFVFVSIAPMLGPVMLPQDFLQLGDWVIVNGEQAPRDRCRPLKPAWARAICGQCAEARIPFFMKGMHRNVPRPPDLRIRQFPSVP
jgi:protein gp37